MKTAEALHTIKTLIKDDIYECCESSRDKECVTDKLNKLLKYVEKIDEKENPKDLNDTFTGYY